MSPVPWQISTFSFAYKCEQNANANYGTNTNKKTRSSILALGRVFKCATASFIKAICILFKTGNRMKNETHGRVSHCKINGRVLNWVDIITNC